MVPGVGASTPVSNGVIGGLGPHPWFQIEGIVPATGRPSRQARRIIPGTATAGNTKNGEPAQDLKKGERHSGRDGACATRIGEGGRGPESAPPRAPARGMW